MTKTLKIDEKDVGQRLDKYINGLFSDFSRSFIQNLIENGQILVNNKKVKTGEKLKLGDNVSVDFVPPKPLEAKPQMIDFTIVYEDSDLLVIDKPQGLVVHPCQTTKEGTLVNGLLEKVKDLSGINGVLRPGIVHRLDKNTSGLMLVAKNDFTHNALAEMIAKKEVKRKYYALLDGVVWDNEGKIETYLARDKKDRKKYAVSSDGKLAISLYKVVKRFATATLVEFSLVTGRTHQLRVHFAHIDCPITGDDMYGSASEAIGRHALHAARLSFPHPRTGERINAASPLWADMQKLVEKKFDGLGEIEKFFRCEAANGSLNENG